MLGSKSSDSVSSLPKTWSNEGGRALSEYIKLVEPPPFYQKFLLEANSSTDVVSSAIDSKQHSLSSTALADEIFLAAVANAGTHPGLVTQNSLPHATKTKSLKSSAITFPHFCDMQTPSTSFSNRYQTYSFPLPSLSVLCVL
jgi:hypothetical protein